MIRGIPQAASDTDPDSQGAPPAPAPLQGQQGQGLLHDTEMISIPKCGDLHILFRGCAPTRVLDRARLALALAAATEPRGRAGAEEALALLTARQRGVAALVAEGCTNAEAARRLGLTEGTVANHIEQAMRRLQIRSRAQLAVWAYRHGLYRPDEEAPEGAEVGQQAGSSGVVSISGAGQPS
jgi:DNA-binding CsgD family transcriptional regulator